MKHAAGIKVQLSAGMQYMNNGAGKEYEAGSLEVSGVRLDWIKHRVILRPAFQK